MDMGDLFHAGSDIMDAVTKAVETGDYSELSDSIQDRIDDAAEQIKEQVRTASGQQTETSRRTAGTTDSESDSAAAAGSNTAARTREKASKGMKQKNYFLQRSPSRNLGMGRFAAGILLAILPGLSTVTMLIMAMEDLIGGWMESFRTDAILMLVLALVTFCCTMLARSGLKKKELIKHYYQYGDAVGTGREYIGMQELEDRTGLSREQIRKDIGTLRSDGILPYAVLDRSGTTLILTDNMYQQYTKAEQARAKREEEERIQQLREKAQNKGTGETWEEASAKVKEEEAKARAAKAHQETEQLRNAKASQAPQEGTGASNKSAGDHAGNAADGTSSLVTEGEAYIKEIRAINDRIPDTEVMSDKLYQLEDIMKRIFEQARKDPSKEKDLRKLMNYYLPTTMKLLNAYADLSEQPEAGDNIRDTKRQIEGSMDAINNAFEKLLDDLFQEQAWDLSSDLNVMKTMMAQDGLAE